MRYMPHLKDYPFSLCFLVLNYIPILTKLSSPILRWFLIFSWKTSKNHFIAFPLLHICKFIPSKKIWGARAPVQQPTLLVESLCLPLLCMCIIFPFYSPTKYSHYQKPITEDFRDSQNITLSLSLFQFKFLLWTCYLWTSFLSMIGLIYL